MLRATARLAGVGAERRPGSSGAHEPEESGPSLRSGPGVVASYHTVASCVVRTMNGRRLRRHAVLVYRGPFPHVVPVRILSMKLGERFARSGYGIHGAAGERQQDVVEGGEERAERRGGRVVANAEGAETDLRQRAVRAGVG